MPLHTFFEQTDYYRENGEHIKVDVNDPCYNIIANSYEFGWNIGWEKDHETWSILNHNYLNMGLMCSILGIPKISRSRNSVDEFCHRLAVKRLISPQFGYLLEINKFATARSELWNTRLITRSDVWMWRGFSTNVDKITKNKFYSDTLSLVTL